MERKVIIIVGPTCSGKTDTGILLAEKLNSPIISADSRQVFKHLSIGTAKPTQDQLNRIKHYFIDEIDPTESFNASKFEIASLKIINELFEKGIIPIVVGGSGLYIKALVEGIMNTVDTDENYREELYKKRDLLGDIALYEELKKVDPESASKMIPQNWKRIVRALEVFHLTGKPIGKFQNDFKREINFECIQYGLNWDRKILYENINCRVDKMIENGLVDEVKNILQMGYSPKLNALNTVGYKEIIAYLNGEFSLNRAAELIKLNTRHFAKKQFTWFRKDEKVKWIDIASIEDLKKVPDIITKDTPLV